MLQPRVSKALFSIILHCLAKSPKERERKERNVQTITAILFLFRNLAFIKDLPSNANLGSSQTKLSLEPTDTNPFRGLRSRVLIGDHVQHTH